MKKSWILCVVALAVFNGRIAAKVQEEFPGDSLCNCLIEVIQSKEDTTQSEYSECEAMLYDYLDSQTVQSDSLSREEQFKRAYSQLANGCLGLSRQDIDHLVEPDENEAKLSPIGIKFLGIVLIALLIPIVVKIIRSRFDKFNTRLEEAVAKITASEEQNSNEPQPQLVDTYEAQSYEGIGQRLFKGSNLIQIDLYTSYIRFKFKGCSVILQFKHLQGAEFITIQDGKYVDVFLSQFFDKQQAKVDGGDEELRETLVGFLFYFRIRKSNAPLKGKKGSKFTSAFVDTIEAYSNKE